MPAALLGHTTSLRINLQKVYDQKGREDKRRSGYWRLRGGVIGVLVKNLGGVTGYQKHPEFNSRNITHLAA
jgi:hypothetical protein